VTMILMHRSVAKIEKKMKNYGVNALRLAARSGGNADNTEDQGRGVMDRIKKRINCLIPTCLRRDDDQVASRSNNLTSQKRAILQMATSYVLAWGFVFIPLMFGLIVRMLLDEFRIPEILIAIFTPLQGLFTFLAYMAPKVRNAKRSKRENLTWFQAFIKAYISRGDRRSTRNTSLTSNRSSTTYQKMKKFVTRRSVSRRSERDTTAMTNTRPTTQGASELPTHVTRRSVSRRSERDTSNKKPRAADEEEKCEEQNTSYERNKVEYNLPPNVAENN
jgi:hypothetical protein